MRHIGHGAIGLVAAVLLVVLHHPTGVSPTATEALGPPAVHRPVSTRIAPTWQLSVHRYR